MKTLKHFARLKNDLINLFVEFVPIHFFQIDNSIN